MLKHYSVSTLGRSWEVCYCHYHCYWYFPFDMNAFYFDQIHLQFLLSLSFLLPSQLYILCKKPLSPPNAACMQAGAGLFYRSTGHPGRKLAFWLSLPKILV